MGYAYWAPIYIKRFVLFAVPLAELLISALLLFDSSKFFGELGILVLLSIFTLVVKKALSSKQEINCNCFGSLVPETFGWKTVVHILLILILDVFLLMKNEPAQLFKASLIDWLSALFLSIGILIIYSIGSNLHEYRKAWKTIKQG